MLTPKKKKALTELFRHETRKNAAKAAGITGRTLSGYFRDPEFKAEYNRLCREMIEDATKRARGDLNLAVATFEEVMKNGDSDTARVSAARGLFEYALKLIEFTDVTERLEELETIIKGNCEGF